MLWVVAAASFAVEKSRAVTQRVAKSERNSVGVNSVVGVASGTGVDGNNVKSNLSSSQLRLRPICEQTCPRQKLATNMEVRYY